MQKRLQTFKSDLAKKRKQLKEEIRPVCLALKEFMESGDFEYSHSAGWEPKTITIKYEYHLLSSFEWDIVKAFFGKYKIIFKNYDAHNAIWTFGYV